NDSIQVIGDEAFAECKNLRKVSFPITIKRIGVSAFQNCESLKQPLFPPEIQIGKNAFKGTRK
ncbi:MAG: leucine-rich repeat protein, partial [Paludibacteraceae bacterium]|nr:leucine-rich repeat protein [Paludibacteraceae bacterium]